MGAPLRLTRTLSAPTFRTFRATFWLHGMRSEQHRLVAHGYVSGRDDDQAVLIL
jgi:hypothetical protein